MRDVIAQNGTDSVALNSIPSRRKLARTDRAQVDAPLISIALCLSLRADNSWPSSTLLISGATFPDHRVGNFGFRLVVPPNPRVRVIDPPFRLWPPSSSSSSSPFLPPTFSIHLNLHRDTNHLEKQPARRTMLFRLPIYVADGCFEFNPA